MQRRKFLQDTSAAVLGIGVFGNITWTGKGYAGDTPTTTDILGPLYRPGAPLRENLNPAGFDGEVLHLRGTIFKEDGKTPMSDCLIEVWQCQADGHYDNVSHEYIYRGSQRVPANGTYHFITTKPVAYPVEEGSPFYRPAHIHMRISAIGQQDLITQIYFTGDPHLDSDPSTKSALSVNRILSMQRTGNKQSEIKFDIVLKKEYVPDAGVFHKIAGIYKMNNNTMMEFYRDGDFLFYKMNHQIWGSLHYTGNNTFTGGVNDTEAKFELLNGGNVKLLFRFIRRRKLELEGTKVFAYDNQNKEQAKVQ